MEQPLHQHLFFNRKENIMAKEKKALENFAESKLTMVGRSLKAGLKSAIKIGSRGGVVQKASAATLTKQRKTKKEIDAD
jgi:hypothetical protein